VCIWADLGNTFSGPRGDKLGRRWLLADNRLGLTCGPVILREGIKGFRLGKEIELQSRQAEAGIIAVQLFHLLRGSVGDVF
jgi:hypothetical protein